MRNINNYIIEKISISPVIEKLKIGVNTKVMSGYNPDNLNQDVEELYSDSNDEDLDDLKWDYCESEIKRINKNYSGFVVTRWDSITKIKDFDKSVNDYSDDLEQIKDRIITGKDMGYEVRLSHGHLEFDCINSGSRGTYYVYALTDTALADVESWFDGEEEDENGNPLDIKKILFKKGNIQIIKL